MQLKLIKGSFTVAKLEDYSQINLDRPYTFISKTDEENSLVCLTEDVPANTLEREDSWRAFRIEGILNFSLIGILAKVSSLLAENDISIFALSTYNTDYILLKADKVEKALQLFEEAGYDVKDTSQSGTGELWEDDRFKS